MRFSLAASAPLVLLALGACQTSPAPVSDTVTDSIVATPIAARAETAGMTGMGDRADDPAIFVHPDDPALSMILGTNKDEGVYVYDLSGAELQRLETGPSNNIDLRGTLAVATNDGTNALSWFDIDTETRTLIHLGDTPLDRIEPYGVCAGRIDDVYHAVITYKDGTIELWAASDSSAGPLDPEVVTTWQVASQPEGCVFDDEAGRLFVGEEEHGIWSIDVRDTSSTPQSVDTIAAGNGLVVDVEGLSIWADPYGGGFLVASAQGADRFVVYDLEPPHAVRGVFTVTASEDGSVDAVTHTDGLDITSAALPGYPRGLVVVQDDGNPEPEQNQNFKLVDWAEIEAALGLASPVPGS